MLGLVIIDLQEKTLYAEERDSEGYHFVELARAPAQVVLIETRPHGKDVFLRCIHKSLQTFCSSDRTVSPSGGALPA